MHALKLLSIISTIGDSTFLTLHVGFTKNCRVGRDHCAKCLRFNQGVIVEVNEMVREKSIGLCRLDAKEDNMKIEYFK